MGKIISQAFAPSNIAFVKYMGKVEGGALNLPENPSLSMTLNELRTYVELESAGSSSDAVSRWVPEMPEAAKLAAGLPASVPALSEKGAARYLAHLERVRVELPKIFARVGLGLKESKRGGWIVRTANTFPASSGIASSASSFAALTLATAAAYADDRESFVRAYESSASESCNGGPSLRASLASLSRQGSGSSCRSLDGPFVRWEGEIASRVESHAPALSHFVIIADAGEKPVSSSEAHRMVKTSPLWAGRPERAWVRLIAVEGALKQWNPELLARETWKEMWEMHSLFHTAENPFTYFVPQTLEILSWLQAFEQRPIVTLDAGPNVHMTVEARDHALWSQRLRDRFPDLRILEDRPGRGAEWIGGAELL